MRTSKAIPLLTLLVFGADISWGLSRATLAEAQVGERSAPAPRLLDRLPSIETVNREMKGAGDRDTAARTFAALYFLAPVSESLNNGRAKAAEYARAEGIYSHRNSDLCKQEPGCDASRQYYSRFFFCRGYYQGSAQFLRALLDKYAPVTELPESLSQLGGKLWRDALAIPVGAARFPPPYLACTTDGQFVKADEDAKEAAAEEVREAREAANSVKIDIQGVWTGIYGRHPELVRISLSGRSIRATKVLDGDASGPVGAVTWEGALPDDTITVGNLPLSLPVKVIGRNAKASTQRLTIESAEKLTVSGFKYPFVSGDIRKYASLMLAGKLDEYLENERLEREDEQHRRAIRYQNLMTTPYMKGSWGH